MQKLLLEQLQKQFSTKDCLVDNKELEQFAQDWTRFHKVNALAIVFPRQETDIQWLVKFAQQNQLALVPSGGRTGLSAGAVATQGEIVVSLDKMNKIVDFNAEDGTLCCQAMAFTLSKKYFTDLPNQFPLDTPDC